MKNFTKKSILQKIIFSILVIIILSNFLVPNISNAAVEEIGGVLLSPVVELLIVTGDAFMYIANACVGNTAWPVQSFEKDQASGVFFGNSIEIPCFKVSPEKIFSNEVELLDVDIISADENGTSIASKLKSIISSWYLSLRNLAIVGLLSVLVYISIRIIISSTATDKSKYKQMLLDWFIALCLVFFMHYIMSFAITMVNTLTKAISKSNQKCVTNMSVYEIADDQNIGTQEASLWTFVEQNGLLVNQNFSEEERESRGLNRNALALDFTSYARVMAENTEDIGQRFGFIIMYLAFVIYTVMFLIVYMKRLIYIIFLTMIAPLVALTYPLDKITDGKAQGFSTWLKEYIFNLLIQPVHLILYTLLVGSAMDIAQQYMIYALVVLGFMLQAEKIVRKLFGFEKASIGQSFMGGAVGGALAMKGLQMLQGSKKSSAKGGKADSSKNNTNIRMNERKDDFNRKQNNEYIRNTLGVSKDNNQMNTKEESNRQSLYTKEEEQEMKDLNEYFANTDNNDAFLNPEEYQAKNDRLTELENRQKEEQIRTQEVEEEPTIEEPQIEEQQIEETNYLAGAMSVGRYVGPSLKKVGLGALKGAGMVAGATTLGTIGIAAGLASDDYSNVVKFGLGAGAIGANLGGNIAGKTMELPSSAYRKAKEMEKELQDVYRKGAYSKEKYQRIKNKELDNAFLKDKKSIEQYREAFKGKHKVNGEDYYKYAMKQAIKYRQHGVTDNDTIIKAMKASSKYASADIADDRRIISAKLAKGVEKHKDIEDIKNRLKEQHINQDQINDQAEMIRQIRDIF